MKTKKDLAVLEELITERASAKAKKTVGELARKFSQDIQKLTSEPITQVTHTPAQGESIAGLINRVYERSLESVTLDLRRKLAHEIIRQHEHVIREVLNEEVLE